MKIDAHVHFWNYDPIRDSWMEGMDILHKNYLPEILLPTLSNAGLDGIVAVQAEQSEGETLFLQSLSDANPIIKGVVGWVDLLNENIEERLDYYSQYSIIKGFRHIAQGEPEGFLLRDNFTRGIKALGKYNYTYDVLIYHHQLNDVLKFMEQFPEQLFIIDHCAKPDIKNKNIDGWKKQMTAIAKLPNVYCKISGLLTETNWKQWKAIDFYPYLDVVFKAFGKDRILFGSDWPVMLLSGEYLEWKELLMNYLNNFSTEEKNKLFGLNAVKIYNLQ
ncbi:MAG: amidohydrolase family protein [Chitinophagaceae bacterium]